MTPCSSALSASALKAAAASSTKKKDTSSSFDFRAEKKRKSALEEIMEVETTVLSPPCVCICSSSDSRCDAFLFVCLFVQMEEKKRKKQQPVRTDYWLQPNIVVKVVTKRLGEKYHKKKAVIMVTVLLFLFWVRARACLLLFLKC